MWHKALKWQCQASSEGLSTPKCFKPLCYTAGPSRLQAGKKRIHIHCKSKLECGLSISGSSYFLRVARNLDFCMKSVKFLLKLFFFFFAFLYKGQLKTHLINVAQRLPSLPCPLRCFPTQTCLGSQTSSCRGTRFYWPQEDMHIVPLRQHAAQLPPGKGLQLPASLFRKTDLQNKDSSYQSFPIELIQFMFIKTSWLYV